MTSFLFGLKMLFVGFEFFFFVIYCWLNMQVARKFGAEAVASLSTLRAGLTICDLLHGISQFNLSFTICFHLYAYCCFDIFFV